MVLWWRSGGGLLGGVFELFSAAEEEESEQAEGSREPWGLARGAGGGAAAPVEQLISASGVEARRSEASAEEVESRVEARRSEASPEEVESLDSEEESRTVLVLLAATASGVASGGEGGTEAGRDFEADLVAGTGAAAAVEGGVEVVPGLRFTVSTRRIFCWYAARTTNALTDPCSGAPSTPTMMSPTCSKWAARQQ